MKSLLIIKIFFFLSIFKTSLAMLQLTCFEPGACLDSMMLDMGKADDQSGCLEMCQQQEDIGCEWFTYYAPTKHCITLSACLRLDNSSCSDCVSGQRECPEFQCGVAGRCLGSFQGFADNVANAQACSDACHNTDGCAWYSFDGGQNLCHMTADCHELDKDCTSCKAYERPCILS